MHKIRLIIIIAKEKSLIIKALKIAFIVGLILNLINQNSALINLDFQALNLTKFLLTFCVPFAVSMYTAISMKMKFNPGQQSCCNVTLRCEACQENILIKKEEIIPFCIKCKEKTNYKFISLDTSI